MTEATALQGIGNFRDFGGFDTAEGVVRSGCLFRSASPFLATQADIAALTAKPIGTVVDLRRRTERIQAPSPLTALAGVRVLENDEGDRNMSQHFEFFQRGDGTLSAVDAYLRQYYENIPFEPRHRSLFSGTFDAIEANDGAILIHCSGGKDRTGFLAALIRTAIGGAWEETVADFSLTNANTLTPDKVAAAEIKLKAILGYLPTDAVVRAYLGVWPHHLNAAFQSAAERCGSIDGYLALLGVDVVRRKRLTELLLA